MKRLLSIGVMTLLMVVSLYAYNAPVGGETLFNLSSPTVLTNASSAAGGSIYLPTFTSIAFNPALSAREQRIQLGVGFTGLFGTGSDDRIFNAAFDVGMLVPTKYLVAAGFVNGVFLKNSDMSLGNSINIRVGVSKEVSEHISVGANIYGGALWGIGNDWSLGADVGFFYRWLKVGLLKDFRLGVSLLNLGKNYTSYNKSMRRAYKNKIKRGEDVDDWEAYRVIPLDIDDKPEQFPTVLTVRAGIASTFLQLKSFQMGFSFDISTPLFQDAIFDVGLQAAIKDMFFISVAEKIDILELKEGHYGCLPAIGFGVKFKFHAKGKYFEEHDWSENEMLINAAWQQKYNNLQTASLGMLIYVGQLDKTGPNIQLWDGEE